MKVAGPLQRTALHPFTEVVSLRRCRAARRLARWRRASASAKDAPSRHPGGQGALFYCLRLGPLRDRSVRLVPTQDGRQHSQPCFTARNPEFICWRPDVGFVERAQAKVDFVRSFLQSEDGRTARLAKMALHRLTRTEDPQPLPCDSDLIPWKDYGDAERCAMLLAAVEAVAKTNTVWLASGFEADRATSASTAVRPNLGVRL